MRAGLIVCLAAWSLPRVHAVIFYSSGDPLYNTSAPTGTLAGSGWQWTGSWNGFQGTPIGPHHFITARHVNGSIGDPYTLNGTTYTTVAFFDDSASDLRIWQVSGTFRNWAPLYRASDEVGKGLIVFGRGVIRGAEIRVNGALKGWQYAPADGNLRWGQNVISAVVDGGSYWGHLLYATFDQSAGPNEADLGTGDSSGPMFINDGSGWKLAGVAAAVDGYFNTTNTGGGFIAAIFDSQGLYYSPDPGTTGWQFIPGPSPQPTGFYVSPISLHQTWIDSIVPPNSPAGSDAPLLNGIQLAALAGLLIGVATWSLGIPAKPRD